jgi:hypothetical protein
MRLRDFFRHYLFSPLGILSVLASLGIATLAGFWGPLGLAVAVFPLSWIVISLLLMFTGVGIRSVTGEQDRSRWTEQAASLATIAAAGKRLATLRLPDAELKQLSGLLALKTQQYVTACQKAKSISPIASHAVQESLEILDDWLETRDTQAQNRHFGAVTASGVASDVADELKTKTLDLLQLRLHLIIRGTGELSGGLSAEDRLAIKEELK